MRDDIQVTLEAIWSKWSRDEPPVAHVRPITGRSRHARRRRNQRLVPSWEQELRRRYQEAFRRVSTKHQRDGMTRGDANWHARRDADAWLRDVVFASWTWAATPDFFGDLWAAAMHLGVNVPLRVASSRLLGPGRRTRNAPLPAVRRIEQRTPYGGMRA